MCYTGKCKWEDYWGECTWDWESEDWPDGCMPTEEEEAEIVREQVGPFANATAARAAGCGGGRGGRHSTQRKKMKISRVWVMPSIWTFTMKPVKELLKKYDVNQGWIDPFAGEHSPAEWTNDIEGRGAKFKMDGLEFLVSLPNQMYEGALFDPPYSVEQCLRRYTPKQGGTAGRAEYWAKCKDEIARILKLGAHAISFCWDSTGMGKKRGFEIVEIVLLCHGACHNDTIVTVEQLQHRQGMMNLP